MIVSKFKVAIYHFLGIRMGGDPLNFPTLKTQGSNIECCRHIQIVRVRFSSGIIRFRDITRYPLSLAKLIEPGKSFIY